MIRPASSITLPNIICIINYDETVSGLMHYINCEKDKSTSTTDRSAGFTSGPWGPVTAEQKSGSGVGSLSQARLKRYPRAAGHDLTVLFFPQTLARCGARNSIRARATGLCCFKQYLMPSNVKYKSVSVCLHYHPLNQDYS